MGPIHRLTRWLRTIGWRFGICSLEAVGPLHGARKANRRSAASQARRSQNSSDARFLRAAVRQSLPPMTAGELSERAERRLKTIGGLCLFLVGCGAAMPNVSPPDPEVLKCQAQVLKSYAALGCSVETVQRVTEDLLACTLTLKAPPPAPGMKAL